MSATGSGLDFVHVHRTAYFSVNMLGMDPKKLAVKIIGNIKEPVQTSQLVRVVGRIELS